MRFSRRHNETEVCNKDIKLKTRVTQKQICIYLFHVKVLYNK
jgi:hypothetical protein